jgi:hypothetical protein
VKPLIVYVMKKVKQSKKRWAWTEAQIRRKNSEKYRSANWCSVPAWFRREMNKQNKAKERMDVQKIKKGMSEEEVDFSPRHHPKSAGWLWW